ncbi:MAG: hypothetical protein ACR2KZ_20780, partial [Segetibacter sp.]
KAEAIKLPVSFTTRRHELAWNYQLPKGKHSVSLKILNPSAGQKINAGEVIVYSDQPVNGVKELEKASKEFRPAS